MRTIKSERLKKLEVELQDLERWLELGLVPKKDIPKHKEEIKAVKNKIKEENERLQFLKESGDLDELSSPKRSSSRTAYTEMPTIPDIDNPETQMGQYSETQQNETQASSADDEEEDDEDKDTVADTEMEDDESYFSDKNRWRRGGRNGGILDPEADDW